MNRECGSSAATLNQPPYTAAAANAINIPADMIAAMINFIFSSDASAAAPVAPGQVDQRAKALEQRALHRIARTVLVGWPALALSFAGVHRARQWPSSLSS